jgi:hypothetical protein
MFMMEVFDINFHRYGFVKNFTFAQYERFNLSVGSFEIDCDGTQENIELLQKDRIVWFEDDIAGIIQYIECKNEESTSLTVKGKLFGVILEWRWIYPTIDKTATINKLIEMYVRNNCIDVDEERKFDFLEIKDSDFELEKITKSQTGGSVEEGIEELTSADNCDSMLSFNVGFYPREKKCKFYLSKGMDRTKGNEQGNKIVLFSQDLKNIINSTYTYNSESVRNVALVAGELNEGEPRRTLIVNSDGEKIGYERRELFVDARDLQSESTDDDGNEIQMTDEEYNATLEQRGNEKLGDCAIVENYSGEVRNDKNTTFIYGRDYFLGDKVDVIDKNINVKLQAIVTSVVVSQDSNGYTVEPSFGFTQPTLIKKLKKKGAL